MLRTPIPSNDRAARWHGHCKRDYASIRLATFSPITDEFGSAWTRTVTKNVSRQRGRHERRTIPRPFQHMSIEEAERATRKFRRVVDEAHDMARAGAAGAVLDETLRHAEDLVDIIDDAIPNDD